jgi:hypothetical protein
VCESLCYAQLRCKTEVNDMVTIFSVVVETLKCKKSKGYAECLHMDVHVGSWVIGG